VNLALRRALRVTVVMPSLYAALLLIADDPFAALFAAFGCFALLVFADFAGSVRARLVAYSSATVIGALLIALGTVVSEEFVLAAALMVLIGFSIRFLGVLGGAWAAGASAVTLSYVLAATVPGPVSAVDGRVVGWLLGGLTATVAAVALWPAYERDKLRDCVAGAVRAAAALVRAYRDEGGDPAAARARAVEAVDTMRTTLDTTRLRPSGPAVRDRALIALVEGVERLVELVTEDATEDATEETAGVTSDLGDCLGLCDVTAQVLDRAADVLVGSGPAPDYLGLETARSDQLAALVSWTAARLQAGADPEDVISDLEGVFWTRITSYLALGIAADAAIAEGGSAAVSNVTGALHTPVVAFGNLRERITGVLRAHSQLRSARFADAARAGLGLGLAVLVAGLTGVDHGFWVVLGTLSVLRSNALATGRTAFEAIGGTLVGFVVVTPMVIVFGHDAAVLWILLPITVFLAAFAPTAISFLVGQAAFTAFVVVLFNILEPEGITTGIARVEDIAMGAAVSIVVGVLLWPRGARGMMRRALADQCRTDADFLETAMNNVVGQPTDTDAPRTRAVEAGLRAVEAFDQLRTEPGTRPVSEERIADVAVSARRVRGVAELMVAQADLGFVVEQADVRETLRNECGALCEVLRADGGAIAGTGEVPQLADAPPGEVRSAAVDAVVSWGGDGPGVGALGALWAWEWVRTVHLALVRATPGVAAIADSADVPWWR